MYLRCLRLDLIKSVRNKEIYLYLIDIRLLREQGAAILEFNSDFILFATKRKTKTRVDWLMVWHVELEQVLKATREFILHIHRSYYLMMSHLERSSLVTRLSCRSDSPWWAGVVCTLETIVGNEWRRVDDGEENHRSILVPQQPSRDESVMSISVGMSLTFIR